MDQTTQTIDVREMVQAYIDAFKARDVAACVSYYTEQATLEFGPAKFQGKKAIEDFHRARFDANLRLEGIDNLTVNGDTVSLDGVIASDRLKAWRISTLPGRATFRIRDGKIADARFSLRAQNPLALLRR